MIEKHDRTVSVPDDGNENVIVVSRIQKNDKVKNEVSVLYSWANAFQHRCYLHAEKSIENMKRYQSIKKHDRTVSVPDDANENIIIVSQIKKNDRVKKKVCVGASFRRIRVELPTYTLRRALRL